MTQKILLWDLPLRLFHWSLVIALFAAWYTSNNDRGLIEYHPFIGYYIMVLLCFRLLWGFLGTKYALFAQFFPTATQIKAYAKHPDNPDTVNMLGHNPLGALMVFTMLFLLTLQVSSGLFMTDDVMTSGPYFESISNELQSLFASMHSYTFDLIVIVSTLHISAVLFYLTFKNKNLITPMITGMKQVSTKLSNQGIPHSKAVIALIIVLICLAFVYWLVVLNAPIIEEVYY